MRVIYKYKLTPTNTNECEPLSIPSDYKVLKVAGVGDNIFVWVVVEPHNPTEGVVFKAYATGQTLPEMGLEGEFLGTALLYGGGLVFHVFL